MELGLSLCLSVCPLPMRMVDHPCTSENTPGFISSTVRHVVALKFNGNSLK